jgi:hypothetical protein
VFVSVVCFLNKTNDLYDWVFSKYSPFLKVKCKIPSVCILMKCATHFYGSKSVTNTKNENFLNSSQIPVTNKGMARYTLKHNESLKKLFANCILLSFPVYFCRHNYTNSRHYTAKKHALFVIVCFQCRQFSLKEKRVKWMPCMWSRTALVVSLFACDRRFVRIFRHLIQTLYKG